MSSRIARFGVLVLIPVTALALTAAAATKAKPPKDMKQECQEHVTKKIKAAHGGAHDIQLTVSREWQPSTTQSGVGGTGTLKAANNSARDFEWTCVYDVKTSKIVDVTYDKPKKDKK
jgi:hypothetical protein